MRLSDAIQRLEENPMSGFGVRARELEKQGKKLIHFEIGEPDFDTPQHAVDAAIKSLREGETHYSSAAGREEFRRAIADRVKIDLGFKPGLKQITVGPGLSLIYFLLRTVANPGDEIIVPDPGFAPYYAVLKFMGLKVVPVALKEEDEFRMKPESVRKQITDKTKLILVNSPSNPTGAVMNQEELLGIYDLAKKHDLYILSDEVYNRMLYEGEHFSPSIKDECRERTIVLNSFSKTYAMTGWRIGYMVGPEFLIKKASLLIQNTIFSVPVFIQKGAIAALTGPQDDLERMMSEYRARRDVLMSGLSEISGISCVTPKGAFYAFPNIKRTGMSSKEFCKFMLENAGVVMLPGDLFGKAGEGYVRLAYSISELEIKEGVAGIKKSLKER